MLSEFVSANTRIVQSGKEFHTDGPTTEKGRRAVVFIRQRGTTRSCRLADQSCCHDATVNPQLTYVGHRPLVNFINHLLVDTQLTWLLTIVLQKHHQLLANVR